MGLKLYVWEGALADYTDGVMFALAESADDARQAILEAGGAESASVRRELEQDPDEYSGRAGFFIFGGG